MSHVPTTTLQNETAVDAVVQWAIIGHSKKATGQQVEYRCCRVCQPFCTTICGSCVVVHMYIFRLRYVTTFMYRLHLYVPTYRGRWMRHGEPISWLPRFLDLDPVVFFIYTHLKLLVYEMSVTPTEDFMFRIAIASTDFTSIPDLFERVEQSFVRRCQLCYDIRGCNFEHFM
ncbi:uncharacterized protein TNCV_355091 [Trichonephila clavipes]|uniref:Uncharacterized protein n=1 Tax=Trichonephila clavipes TaxID=2585209 RepID=A0A8X7BC18_TRICX|nr:uncharacterized protein TNCV_355091 [Trichonephila clavipes]